MRVAYLAYLLLTNAIALKPGSDRSRPVTTTDVYLVGDLDSPETPARATLGWSYFALQLSKIQSVFSVGINSAKYSVMKLTNVVNLAGKKRLCK